MSEIAGTATGCVAGHSPRIEYARWLWWLALSSWTPSQQLGKLKWRRRPAARVSAHVGTVALGGTPACAPQFQNVIRTSCGTVARLLPAIIFRPGGNASTRASVLRR